MDRRRFLIGSGAAVAALPLAGLAAPSTHLGPAQPTRIAPAFAGPRMLQPLRATPDRVIALSVCTRPFRAQGPRIEAEKIGRRHVVHNYGHGGSGWSLSWGSAEHVLRLLRDVDTTELAVVGCGAIGLTTAIAAQRAGLRVRIYAKDRFPDVRSFYATGSWTPDSRVCSAEHATADFRRRWEEMARISFRRYQTMLGLPGEPIEWRDGFVLSDTPFDRPVAGHEDHEPAYPHLENELLRDISPRSVPMAGGEHPFPVPFVRRFTHMTFNIAAYSRLLMDEFLMNGGEVHTRSFDSPRQFADLREKAVVNATGYGARALLGDDSIIPVRGQTARLIPQPEVDYGIVWRGNNVNMVPRRDGILVQAQDPRDFGNADDTPDRAATDAAVAKLATLFAS